MNLPLSKDKYNIRKQILFGTLDRFIRYFCLMKELQPASKTSNILSISWAMQNYKSFILIMPVGVRENGSVAEICIRDFQK